METNRPETTIDRRFSDPNATPRPWSDAVAVLQQAETCTITTVRPDGRPHMTPLMAIWVDDAIYFCTGPTEQKARNLETNTNCIIATAGSSMSEGFDVVVEGNAVRQTDEALLQRLAAAYAAKYGKYGWHFDVRDGTLFSEDGGNAIVFEVAPRTGYGFGKGDLFSQTRWRFDSGARP